MRPMRHPHTPLLMLVGHQLTSQLSDAVAGAVPGVRHLLVHDARGSHRRALVHGHLLLLARLPQPLALVSLCPALCETQFAIVNCFAARQAPAALSPCNSCVFL